MRRLSLTLAIGLFSAPALADQPVISTSNDVLAAMARTIAGPDATVVVPVPEGTDPGTFSPDIDQIAQIQNADLIVLNGAGYEDWAARISLPRARTIDTTAAFEEELIAVEGLTHGHGDSPAHSHDGIAPVVWLDFTLAARQAGAIAGGLTRQFPADADAHAANLATLEQRLSALDAQARGIGMALEGQTLLIAHPGYEYFSRAYGIALHEATFDPTAPATPDQLHELDHALSESPARIMLWNAAPPAETAAALAARDIAVVVLPNGAQTPEGEDPLDHIETGLAALAAIPADPAPTIRPSP